MILYFDSYVTDVPLPGRGRHLLKEDIRKNCPAYAMPKRLDITKYVLASYAMLPWSYALIRYELDNSKLYHQTDRYIRSLFPNAYIIHKRSNNQNIYNESLKILERIPDDWVFYAPNNDHPLISADKNIAEYIQKLISIAEAYRKKYPYVSIMYSHFSEFLNIGKPGNPEHFLHGRDTKLIADTDLARIYLMPKGDFASVQIVHKSLLKQWFSSTDLGDMRVIRAEDVRGKVKLQNHIIIAPKKIICAHFDGYEHMLGHSNEIPSDEIPPLLIPPGFFTNNIKVAYAYPTYRPGWININPSAKLYSFRDQKYGTDLKIAIADIPLFWISRIATIDINTRANNKKLMKDIHRQKDILFSPWSFRNQSLSKKTLIYWIRFLLFFTYVNLRSLGSNRIVKQLLRISL